MTSLFVVRPSNPRVHQPFTCRGILTILRYCLFLLGVAGLATAAHASPIVYTYSGVFSGSLGATTFTNQAAVFTFRKANTNNIVNTDNAFFTNTQGTGTFRFGTTLATFLSSSFGVESEYGAASFLDATTGFAVGEYNELTPYDVLSTYGSPITGDFVSYGNTAEATSLGNLIITGATGQVTFQASAPTTPTTNTPEPAGLMLTGTGLLALAGAARRRCTRT